MNVTTVPIEIQPQSKVQPLQPFFKGTMPVPPGVNRSYKPGNRRHPIVSTKELAQFKKDAALMLADYEKTFHDWSLINAIRDSRLKVPLRMNITFYFKSLWKSDIDGGIKAVIDAVFHRLDLNDVLNVKLCIEKYADPDRPRVEVEVYCDLSSR